MSYASRGLGQTIGQAVRRLENQKYAVQCDGWAQMAGRPGRVVSGMREAMLEAKKVLRTNRDDTCRIFAMPVMGWMTPGKEVVALRMLPSGQLDVRFNYALEGLGQAKIVPGQISFQTLPEGRSGFPNLEPLVQAGLPIAPYIEHGSRETGQPDIMRYGLDPYRGIMGLGQTNYTRGVRGHRPIGLGQTDYTRGRPGHRPIGLRGAASLGQILTSTVCDPTSVSRAFQDRLRGALNAGTQAALVGGAVAGLVGAVAGKRSLAVGAVAGALVGWTANLVWTATHRA